MPRLGAATILGRHRAGVTCVRIAPQDRRVFSSSLDHTVRVWPGRKALVRFPKVRLYANSAAVTKHAITLAINGKYLICGMQNGTVDLHSLEDGSLIRSLPNPPEGSSFQYNFHTVAAHPANPEIVAGSNGGYLVVWSAADGIIVWRETKFRLINTVRFLRGGQFLMAHEWDPWIHLWDFEARKRIRLETSIMETSANWVTACAAPAGSRFDFVISTEDADESKLVGVNIDQEDVVWEVEAEARVHDLCFLPDGRHLVAGGDSGVLELWDTEGDEPIQQLDLREDPVLAGEFGENEKGGGGGLILTTPTLDGESYPPWTIHSLDVAPNGSFATLGLANGLVLEVGIER